MSKSMRDNPNRRLSDGGVAVGDFAVDPDCRRDEGKRFELATVLLYSILGMVAGANSYRQMHEFIRVHRQRLNEAFGLALRGAPSYTGLRDILQGVEADALEAAFRAHASSVAARDRRRDGHRRRWQNAARQLRRLRGQESGAHAFGCVSAWKSDPVSGVIGVQN